MDEATRDSTAGLEALAAGMLRSTATAGDLFAGHTFIELGGTSILAMRLAARAAEELSVQVPIEALLSSRPLRDALRSARPHAGDAGNSGEGAREHSTGSTASPGQRGMWAAEQLTGQPSCTR